VKIAERGAEKGGFTRVERELPHRFFRKFKIRNQKKGLSYKVPTLKINFPSESLFLLSLEKAPFSDF
jgi:hypothetical protein